MQHTDLGHGRGWLDAPAAASIRRLDAAHGSPWQITEAGRTYERQAYLYDGWIKRKPGFNLAAKPGTSPHEAGNAIDTDQRDRAVLLQHGWVRTIASEDWHFVYYARHDQHLHDATPDAVTLTPTPAPALEQIGEEMLIVDLPNGTFLVIPQGTDKPRAVVLDGDSGAPAGLPRLKFSSTGSIGMLTAAVRF